MKILAFADLQCHAYQQFHTRTERGLNSRFQDCLDIVHQATALVRQHGVDLVVFAGDLFEARTKLDIDVYTETYRAFELLSRAVDKNLLMVCGNHDQHVRLGNIHSLVPFCALGRVVAGNDERIPVEAEVVAAAHAYTTDIDSLKEWLNNLPKTDLLVLHQTISEAVAGPVDTHLTDGISIADIPTDRIGMVISGHIHKRQNLLLGRVHIPGSPLQLTFGEAGEDKAFSLIDTTTWTVETIPTNAPRFFKFDYPDMDLSGVNTMRDFVRVTYDREHADAIQRLTEQYPRIDFVENAKDETIFRTTEKAADDDQQLLREYLRHASLDGMDEEMLLETGLELLAGEQA